VILEVLEIAADLAALTATGTFCQRGKRRQDPGEKPQLQNPGCSPG